MEQIVFVKATDLKDGVVLVGCGSKGCEACKASMFCDGKTRTFEAANPDGIALAPGDRVRIFLPPGRTILSSVLLFGLPLALFPLLYLLAPSESEFVRAGAGLAGGLAGFLAAGLLFRRKKAALMPVVVSKLGSNAQDCQKEDCSDV